MDSISNMDSISIKHIEKGKNQILIILLLGIVTFISSIFALGLGSSEKSGYVDSLGNSFV